MRKTFFLFAALFTMAASAAAATSTVQGLLDESAAALDREGSQKAGAKTVTQKLSREFGIGEKEINELRGRHLGFGEIAIASSIAKAIPGGATDENIDRVVKLRQHAHLGWGEIAEKFDVKLGAVESQVHRVAKPSREVEEATEKEANEVRAKAPKAKADADATADMDAKAERSERFDRADRPERSERPERPERP